MMTKICLEHCLEVLRVAIMCHADVSMWSIKWIINEKNELDYKPQSAGERSCVRWSSVEDWARQRVAPSHRILAEPDMAKVEKINTSH
jgi:hypothetical protein